MCAKNEKPFWMTLVDFPRPFHVSFDRESGNIKIGHITIETD